ncbi:MAG: NAD(P)-dependent oxidoreductase [Pseudomonadota bacterium]|nr:NAD(P)-dependent oxidoreductase [Pseudomonadota bacterium]
MAQYAFLGIGLMGSRMSQRLLQAGHRLSIWNRTRAATDMLAAQGAQVLTDLSQPIHADVIGLCLADDAAVRQVAAQLIPQLQAGQIVVDFSSITAETTRDLAQQAQARNAFWVDAPVSGGVIGAEQGSLVIFAGGDAQAIQQLTDFFAPLSQRVTHMGDSGTGQVTKICNQLIVAANSTLIAEAIALAQQAGVDATQLAPALAGGFADSKPLQILAPRMATQNFEPVQWKVQTLNKDLSNALNLAQSLGLLIPVAQQAQQRLQQHVQAGHGHAEADLSSIIQLYWD